jgi:hypothetical protein
MAAPRKALNESSFKKTGKVGFDSYAKAYLLTMYDVVFKPQTLLNSIANPLFVFLLKFIHPKMFLNRTKTAEFLGSTGDKRYQLTLVSEQGDDGEIMQSTFGNL